MRSLGLLKVVQANPQWTQTRYSTAPARHANGADWQEEVYQMPSSNIESGQGFALNSLQQFALGSVPQTLVSASQEADMTALSSQSGVSMLQANFVFLQPTGAFYQLFCATFEWFHVRKGVDNPIKFSIMPLVFLVLLACSRVRVERYTIDETLVDIV
ncbi:hypothetical protein ACE6H2_018953 [Prunus campanulata]